jgi:hypothetical protein
MAMRIIFHLLFSLERTSQFGHRGIRTGKLIHGHQRVDIRRSTVSEDKAIRLGYE